MSTPLRKKRANTVVWILMALLILGLGGFGATNFGGSLRTIGSVGDQEIGLNDYARALNAEIDRVSRQIGQPVSLAMAQALGIDRVVQAQLLAGAALDHEAGRLGISVGDDEVRRRILALSAFQGIDGSFDRDTYRLALRQQGLSEGAFEAQLRAEAARAILQGAVQGGMAAPEALVARLADWVTETRSVTIAELTAADLPEPVGSPDEAALMAHYAAHPADFTRPESRRISYVWLSPDDLLGSVPLDEEALKAAYQARIDEFVTPERRLVERLTYPTRAEAEAAKARVDAGTADFADLAAERGLTLADVDLGEVSRDDLGAAADAVFALSAPGVAGPVETDLGPALFAMNGILEAQEISLDEAREALSGEVAMDRARRMVAERAEAIEDQLAGGATLEEVAEAEGMTFGSIAFSAGTEEGIAAYPAFRDTARSVTAEDFPTLAALDDGGVFALRLDAVEPAMVEPFEAVRDRVAAAWTTAETASRLAALGAEIAAQLANGATLASTGLVTTRHDRIGRDAFLDGVPAAVITEAFAIDAPGTARVVSAEGRVHVVALDAVHPAAAGDEDHDRATAAFAAQIAQSIAGDLFESFTRGIEAEAGISLNPVALDAVHVQMQ
ncbi:MAG: peptidylprolyl isomerase [Alphaproteobacteria bacterium HGW-Alphaproteobacteria-6]|nr:MAG: peptidylprolyl isomerase [Alphaproteobacteria bacterium HGW-Alphaproteobacteria-6]